MTGNGANRRPDYLVLLGKEAKDGPRSAGQAAPVTLLLLLKSRVTMHVGMELRSERYWIQVGR